MDTHPQHPEQPIGPRAARTDRGDRDPSELLEVVYDELRRLAAVYLGRERADHTLQPTALVHEAYAKLAGQDSPFANRAHFIGLAAQAMRRVLVDHARGKQRSKRGGAWQRVELDVGLVEDGDHQIDLVELDTALTGLAELSERQSRVVELRFFGGLSVEAVAELLDVSPRTVKREWRFARAWLSEQLDSEAT